MWSSIAFAACLLAISIGMLFRHRQAWRSAARRGLDDREHDYRYRQYWRRSQASALIGVTGLAVVGDTIVITAGIPPGAGQKTNMVDVHVVPG